jgi:ribosomal protein S8
LNITIEQLKKEHKPTPAEEVATGNLISENDRLKQIVADLEASLTEAVNSKIPLFDQLAQSEKTNVDQEAIIKDMAEKLQNAEKVPSIPIPEVDNTELSIAVNKLLEAEDYIAHLEAEKAEFVRNQFDLQNELINTEQKLSDNRQDSSRNTQELNDLRQTIADLSK